MCHISQKLMIMVILGKARKIAITKYKTQTRYNPKSSCEYYHHLLVTFDNAFIFAHAVL